MKIHSKKLLSVIISGVVLSGLLVGCGSQDSKQDSNGPGGQRDVQALENAGVSESDTQTLAKLIQQTHTDPGWVMDQLRNKKSVSSITSDINNGKATKMQLNGNQKPNPDDQNNQSGNSNQNSNGGSGNTSNSN